MPNSSPAPWRCSVCEFSNAGNSWRCKMCDLPKAASEPSKSRSFVGSIKAAQRALKRYPWTVVGTVSMALLQLLCGALLQFLGRLPPHNAESVKAFIDGDRMMIQNLGHVLCALLCDVWACA